MFSRMSFFPSLNTRKDAERDTQEFVTQLSQQQQQQQKTTHIHHHHHHHERIDDDTSSIGTDTLSDPSPNTQQQQQQRNHRTHSFSFFSSHFYRNTGTSTVVQTSTTNKNRMKDHVRNMLKNETQKSSSSLLIDPSNVTSPNQTASPSTSTASSDSSPLSSSPLLYVSSAQSQHQQLPRNYGAVDDQHIMTMSSTRSLLSVPMNHHGRNRSLSDDVTNRIQKPHNNHNNNYQNNNNSSSSNSNNNNSQSVGMLNDSLKKQQYQFDIVRLIANGGFSRVYEVECLTGSPITGRMAVKELLLLNNSGNDSENDNNNNNNNKNRSDSAINGSSNNNKGDQKATRNHPVRNEIQMTLTERVQEEIKVFQHLSQHENVVTYFDSYIDHEKGVVFIFQELCDMNLKTCIETQMDRISDLILLDWCRTIARVLVYVHEQGYIHRDIKPANILFKRMPDPSNPTRKKLVLKLCDFGLSKNIVQSDAKTNVGSACFIAPEVSRKNNNSQHNYNQLFNNNTSSMQGTRRKYTNKCDVWSFGVLVYQLVGRIGNEMNLPDFERLLQEKPKVLENSKHLKTALMNPDHVLHKLALVCVRCLQLNPDDRPSAAEINTTIG